MVDNYFSELITSHLIRAASAIPIPFQVKATSAGPSLYWRSIELGNPLHSPYSHAVSLQLNLLCGLLLPTSHRFNITIAHDSTTTHSSSRSSSPITDDGEDSSGTGVRVSPTSAAGSQEYTDSLEETEGWVLPVYPDEIGPSDSASRPRTSNQHRPLVEAPRPEAARRQPSRRQVGHDRVHHHSHPRAHRPPPPIAPESVDPNEEWREAFYGRGPPQHPPRAYAHWGHVAGNSAPNYAPSHSSAQAYSAFPTSSLNPPTQQLVPFASPISGYGYSHYQAAPGGSAPGYFPPPHHGGPSIGNHMGAHGGAPYSGQEMVPHPSAAYYPYGLQGYSMAQPMAPPAIYHYPTVYSPPSTTPPPPVDNSKDDEKFARLEKILMDQKAEQDAKEAAAKKAAEDQVAEAVAKKKIADEIAAAASAAAAAATSEAEKKAAEEAAKNKAAAEEKAAADKAAAEKAAEEKAAADKAAAEKAAAEKAAAEIAAAEKAAADKAVAEAAAAAAAAVAAATPPPPPPPPEEKKKPIKFKDAVGRKFSFPFHLCNTWMVSE